MASACASACSRGTPPATILRHISHELKTPLSSLREGADLLAEHVTGRLSQQQQEIVEIVRQNGIELQRLIENLIDYNQLPHQELTFEEIDLNALWQELLKQHAQLKQQLSDAEQDKLLLEQKIQALTDLEAVISTRKEQ